MLKTFGTCLLVLGLMGEIILATVLMELGEAVVKELERNLGGLLALKEMLVELLTINDIDSAGLVGTDGDGSGIAVETVGDSSLQGRQQLRSRPCSRHPRSYGQGNGNCRSQCNRRGGRRCPWLRAQHLGRSA